MKRTLIATHSGEFHADDAFAVATLELALSLGKEEIEIIRTRDEDIIHSADWVLDVGGIYDPETKRFDHHQLGSPVRKNGIPYAAFGLMWKHVGVDVTGNAEVAKFVDEQLVQDIDAADNGSHSYTPNPEHKTLRPTTIDNLVQAFRAPWGENINPDTCFPHAVAFAKGILERTIAQAHGDMRAKEIINEVIESYSDTIPVFETLIPSRLFPSNTPFGVAIMPYDKTTGSWKAQAMRIHPREFKTRVLFPKEWAGLRDEEFKKVSNVSDAKFCHLSRTMAFALSKEGALALAKQAKSNED
ncbi:MAG: MYG1 family protein [Candidatus Pacebacteria bacterium]|nr:MYG1 family protein [Candidatus Paceibacterota bacterium]